MYPATASTCFAVRAMLRSVRPVIAECEPQQQRDQACTDRYSSTVTMPADPKNGRAARVGQRTKQWYPIVSPTVMDKRGSRHDARERHDQRPHATPAQRRDVEAAGRQQDHRRRRLVALLAA